MTRPEKWPSPTRNYSGLIGHLPRWGADSLELLEEGARLGPVFTVQLWRPVTIGHSPAWNRLVLGNTAGFRSRGSMSQLSPYLAAGIVATDAPDHRARRALLNPAFHRRMVTPQFADQFAAVVREHLPQGEFDAVAWASRMVRALLSTAFLGRNFPDRVLRSFLTPLDQGLPGPLLPRPFRIRTMDRALHRTFADPDPETLAPLFASIPGGVQEARVAIAAAYDTTAHTLAFALWELAGHPELNTARATESMVQETMRLYPAGWIGSRVAVTDTEFDGRKIPAGRMVLYSPYLTHRNPQLWDDPLTFRPDRFTGRLPAWGYLPFAAGERTCLGAALATLMLRTVISAFAGAGLQRISTAVRPRGVITLTPDGPIVLRRTTTTTTTATSTSTSTMTGTATYTAPVHVPHRPGAPMVASQPLWG